LKLLVTGLAIILVTLYKIILQEQKVEFSTWPCVRRYMYIVVSINVSTESVHA